MLSWPFPHKSKTMMSFSQLHKEKLPFQEFSLFGSAQAERKSPTGRTMVNYSGKTQIDSGAIACEFVEDMIERQHQLYSMTVFLSTPLIMCKTGIFVPPVRQWPLDKCAYNSIFTETDLTNVDEKDLPEKEKLMLDDIRLDCTNHSDFIIEHGFTGIADQRFIWDIVSSFKVRFVSNCMLYMKEFKKGLDVYGLGNIEINPDDCQHLLSEISRKIWFQMQIISSLS